MKKNSTRALRKHTAAKSRLGGSPAPPKKGSRPTRRPSAIGGVRAVTSRQQAEEALRKSELAYRTLVETSHDLIWSVDAQGRWTFVNAAARRIYGYEPAEMLGRPFMDFESPEQAEKDLKAFASIKTGHPFFNYETEHRRKDGTPVWLSFNAVVLRDEQGNVLGTTGTARDITDLKQAEVALRESECRYREFMINLPVATYTTDADGRVVLYNEAAVALWGRYPEQGEFWCGSFKLYTPDGASLPHDQCPMAVAVRRNCSLHGAEAIVERTDGTRVNILANITPIRDASGKLQGAMNVVLDITERKQAEAALKLFRTLVDHSNDALEVIDPDTGRFLDVSQRGCTDLGYSRDELLTMRVFDIDPVIDPSAWTARIAAMRRDGSTTVASQHRRKDGTMFPVEVNVTFVTLDRDYLVCVVRDITERKRAQEALHIKELAIQTAVTGICFTNIEGHLTDANSAFLQMWGVDNLKELLGKSVVELGSDPAIVTEIIKTIQHTGSWVGEDVARRKDGSTFIVQMSTVLIRDASARPVGMMGTFIDITERKRAEQALHESERFARGTLDGLSAHIAIVDEKGVIIGVNQAWQKFATSNTGELDTVNLGTNYLTVCESATGPDADAARQFAAGIRAVIAGCQTEIVVEYPCHSPTSQQWFVGRASRFPSEGPVRVVVAHTDITERKRAEAALWESENRLKQAQRIGKLGSLDWDLTTNELIVSEETLEIYGLKKEQTHPTLEQIKKLLHPDDRARVEKSLSDAIAGIAKHDMEHRMVRPDGKEVYLRATAELFLDNFNKPVRLLGTVFDITELKRAEDALRLAGAALEAAANAIFITDSDGVIHYTNMAFTTLSGYTASEAIGRKPSLVKSDAHDETFYKSLWQTVLGGRVWHGQITNRHKDGHSYISEQTISPVKDASGQITHFVSVQHDITARKKTEDELRWKTAFFEAQVDSALDGILVVDSQGKNVLQNQRMNDLWKIPREFSEDKDDSKQLAFVTSRTKNPKQFAEKVAYLYAQPDEVSRDEIEVVDGTVLERYSSPVRDKAGKNYGRIWTFRDITERRKLEEQFRQSQKMESIGQLAGGVAHDFNNILTIIEGHASLLQMDGHSPEEHAAALQQIIQAAERAANLTRQLLAFSRRQVMLSRPLDLNEVSTNMTRMLQRLIGENIVLETRYAPKGAPVHADPGMMEQVLLNLAVNARDAMPNGGKILIQTECVRLEEAQTHQHLNQLPGDFICLSVRDTGCGITPEHQRRIFEPFFTTKEVGKGTGLGLATVFGIIEQHHGWIEVESEVGHGTAFHIFLPRQANAPASLTTQKTIKRMLGGHETILLVEDEPSLRVLTRKVLERHGYVVHDAPSGATALEVWRQQQGVVDLLLTDMVMPDGVSGRELGERLQAGKPQLKIIYMSGYPGDVAGQGLSLNEGVNFLQKPFSPTKLTEIVRDALDAK